jgi:hypothetical protein
MKNAVFVSLFAALFFLAACNKDEPDPTSPKESVLDYYPLAVGNYWVYQRSRCDSAWGSCDALDTDTSRIVKDTLINNKTYYKIISFTELGTKSIGFLRDSLDYIVSSTGNIILSNKDFETVLKEKYEVFNEDTIYYYYAKMYEVMVPVETPAGNFECLDYKISLFTKKDNFEKETGIHHLFAKGIGPVFSQAIYLFSEGGYKLELVDYHINK